jgi:hypothetical protein
MPYHAPVINAIIAGLVLIGSCDSAHALAAIGGPFSVASY